MPIKLSSLTKLETPAASDSAHVRRDDERLVVLVKLRGGAARPTYIKARGDISSEMFSAEIRSADLVRLENDPAVESISVSRKITSVFRMITKQSLQKIICPPHTMLL